MIVMNSMLLDISGRYSILKEEEADQVSGHRMVDEEAATSISIEEEGA